MITLAAFATMLLGSCSKINERIDNLEKKVDGIENEKIASIQTQVANIGNSISDLGTIRSNIQSLTDGAKAQGQDIAALQAADKALGKRIEELSKYVGDTLKAYATEEWVKATFSTLEQYKKTCDTIAKIDARIGALDENLSKKIADCADSLTTWINVKFEAYYTAAEMDAKLALMKSAVDSAKAAGEITDAKADSLAVELAKVQPAIDSAKTQLTREYTAAIDTAITTLDGKLTKQIQDEIEKVNETVAALAQRVGILEFQVRDLLGRVGALEGMIQSVTIVPAYSDGSVKVEDDTLFIECLVNPAKAVWGLTMKNFTVYLHEVVTKAVNYREIKINDRKCFSSNPFSGTVSIKVPVKEYMPENPADSSLVVALNVKYRHSGNLTSDYTTEFVPVTLPGPPEGFVDLGVVVDGKPLYWAECNLGASNPEEYGDYFAWGETEPYYTTTGGWPTSPVWKSGKESGYVWKSYPGFTSVNNFATEWDPSPYDATSKVLLPAYDAATATNPKWRTPTTDEFKALAESCVWWSTDNYNGKAGYFVYKAKNEDDKGKAKMNGTWKKWDSSSSEHVANTGSEPSGYTTSDTHIFLPIAGSVFGTELSYANEIGYYWTSTLCSDETISAYVLYFTCSYVDPQTDYWRYFGSSIRPVSE